MNSSDKNDENSHGNLSYRIKKVEHSLFGNGQPGVSQKVEALGNVAAQGRILAALGPTLLSIVIAFMGYFVFAAMEDITLRSRESGILGAQHTERVRVLERRIEKYEATIKKNEGNISTVAATTEAHLREVETQIRGNNEVYNIRWQGMRTLISMIYRQAFDTELPEENYYPNQIPAAAVSNIGEIGIKK